MADLTLYTQLIKERNQGTRKATQRKRVSEQASLNTDFGDVTQTGSNPGARPISGAFKGTYGKLMAKELKELAQASGYGEVVYFEDDGDPLNDAYVTVDNFSTNRASPRTGASLFEFDGEVTENGTRRSHFRSVDTQPVAIDNPFANAGTALIGAQASSTKVRWYDQKGQTIEQATIQNTLSGRFGDVELYDPTEPTFDNPTLIYKQVYADEGAIDARVWDDFDRDQLDADGVNSWQKVFITGHNYAGSAVVENGLLRMTLDEDGESLTFEEWDSANATYSSVSLGTSDWVLTDYNFVNISPMTVEGQARFRNTADGSLHSLDFQVNRASNRVLFITPPNEGTIPSGLSTKLDPIAENWTDENQAVRSIIARSEVNQ